MTTVVAVCDHGATDAAVLEAAAALGRAVGAAVRVTVADARQVGDEMASRTVLAALSEPGTLLGVLPQAARVEDRYRAVLTDAPVPMLLAPADPDELRHGAVERVLVPVDGTPASAAAAAGTLRLFGPAGVEVVVVQVFDDRTVPRFWDHSGHADRLWRERFRRRFCPDPSWRLDFRSGEPVSQIAAVAEQEHVDLVALGWSQRLEQGRAHTVRSLLAHDRLPVLLFPVDRSGASSDGGVRTVAS